MESGLWTMVLLATIAIAACSPASQPTGTRGAAPASEAGTAQSTRTLSIVMRVEPPTMMDSSVDRSAVHKPLFSATLGYWNLQNEPYPVLAESVPLLNSDTWKVSPDGRMETT